MKRNFNNKTYELSNHLGNVMVTVSDKRLGQDSDGNGMADFYLADVTSATDYYPFGKVMPGRSYSPKNYKFGFNGKLNDTDFGNTLVQDYGYRIYSLDLGKFLSVDPLSHNFPWNSTYAFAENDVIRAIDLEGGEKLIVILFTNPEGNTDFRIISDRKVIEDIWRGLSTKKDAKWIEEDNSSGMSGETRYQFGGGGVPKGYFPTSLNDEGILIMNVTNPSELVVSYVGWQEDNKLKQEKVKADNNEMVRSVGSLIENSGDALVVIGTVGAPFTEGASLALVPIGEAISINGNLLQFAADIDDQKFNNVKDKALIEGLSFAITTILQGTAEKYIKIDSDQVPYLKDYLDAIISKTAVGIEQTIDASKKDNGTK